jgi:hypothetical protein
MTLSATARIPVQYSRRAAGHISSAYRAPRVSFVPGKKPRSSYAKRLGITYQKKVEVRLCTELSRVELQPHFRFVSGGVAQSAFPDAMIDLGSSIVLIEIKLKHTYDAWAQLTRLYLPILKYMYPGTPIRRLEICKNYDPAIILPEPFDLIQDLGEWIAKPRNSYGVLIWGR